MSQANPAPERQFNGRLARSMLLILLLLSMAPLLLMGSMAYLRARTMLRDQVHSLLTAVAGAQAQRIETQFDTGLLLLSRAAVEQEAADSLDILLTQSVRSGSDFSTARLSLLETLQTINQPSPFYTYFLVVLPDGTVEAATNRGWEGQQIVTTLLGVNPAVSAVPGGLPGLTDEQLQVIASVPVQDGYGQVQGYLIGVASSTVLKPVIEKSTFYTQQNYFVTSEGKFIGISPYGNSVDKLMDLQPSPAQQQAISSGLAAGQGIVEVKSFSHEPVIAAYTWIPGLEIGWVGEITQSSVYSQINTLLLSGLAIFLILTLAVVLLAGAVSRRLAHPIRSLSDTVRLFASGNWEQRVPVDRKDEIGLLAYSFNQMADELSNLYQSLESQVETRTRQIQNASKVASLAGSASSLDELLRQLVRLLQERFSFASVACSLIDESGQFAVLRNTSRGEGLQSSLFIPRRVRVDGTSLIGRAISSKQVSSEINPASENREDLPSSVTANAAVPILLADQALGALLVQSTEPGGFFEGQIEELQSLVNSVAPAIQNFFLLEATQVDLEETRLISFASNQVVQANSEAQVLDILQNTLRQTVYRGALLLPDLTGLRLAIYTQGRHNSELTLPALEDVEKAFEIGGPVVLADLSPDQALAAGIPDELPKLAQEMGCASAAFLPVLRSGRLASLLILAAPASPSGAAISLNPTRLRSYLNLAELVTTNLEKIQADQDLHKRLDELHVIAAVSQAISLETDPEALYRVVYEQIANALGEVDLSIALFDAAASSISMPYCIESGQRVQVDPFPLGEDLISSLIRTRQPLLRDNLLEDKDFRGNAGDAKSWLGVPMIVAGEPAGALILKDKQHEGRFTPSDLRLISTLAGQIAAALRNATLLEYSRRQAESERQVLEITSRIRRSADLHTILETTAVELGQILGARRAHIAIHPAGDLPEKPGTPPATPKSTPIA